MPAVPFTFTGLPAYRADEVRLWNWFHAAFPGQSDWRRWAAEVFSHLLLRPSGTEAFLTQTNALEPQQEERRCALERDELLLGRAPENDIVLPAKAIGKRHARIFRRDGVLMLEDLGSPFGTHAGSRKLAAHQPEPLRDGDAFTIFPYQFRVTARTGWAPESRAEIYARPCFPASWEAFASRSPAGAVQFTINVHPFDEPACLEGEAAFFNELVRRLLAPLGLQSAAWVPSDRELIEFVLLSVLEAAGREMAFPLRLSLGAPVRRSRHDFGPCGIAAPFSVGLSGLAGAFRLFIPYGLLAGLRDVTPPRASMPAPDAVSWRFPVCAGYVDLLPDEIRHLEPLDILLFTREAAVLLPGATDRGWRGTLEGDNPWRVRIDNYQDRSARMQETPEIDQASRAEPDLQSLPLRLHVVLGEKELSLAEANGLAPNTILELDTGKSDPVRLAINGRIVGHGQLVEVDGKLGVRIMGWS